MLQGRLGSTVTSPTKDVPKPLGLLNVTWVRKGISTDEVSDSKMRLSPRNQELGRPKRQWFFCLFVFQLSVYFMSVGTCMSVYMYEL
jgi:hypothetical protein